MSDPTITFRPIAPDDSEFLYTVYANARAEELALVDWLPAQKEAFLRSQFNAQHEAYQATYRGGDFLVILKDGQPAGRLYVARWEREIRIVDIALQPKYRKLGLGSSILKDILQEGQRTGKRVSIHVEMFNPALRLYERLGFQKVREHGCYHFMEWLPRSTAEIES